jgi:hypothetical protein
MLKNSERMMALTLCSATVQLPVFEVMIVDNPNSHKMPPIVLRVRFCKNRVAKLAQLSRQFVINIDFSQAQMMVLLLVCDSARTVAIVRNFA